MSLAYNETLLIRKCNFTCSAFAVMEGDSNSAEEICKLLNGIDLQKQPIAESVKAQHLVCSNCRGLPSENAQLASVAEVWPSLQQRQKLAILVIASIPIR